MTKFTTLAAAIGIAAGISLSAAAPASAFNFSFDTNGVAFAYNDGYWDHDHQWHAWRNAAEAREYHKAYGDKFHAWKHTRDKDMGWTEDHDRHDDRR